MPAQSSKPTSSSQRPALATEYADGAFCGFSSFILEVRLVHSLQTPSVVMVGHVQFSVGHVTGIDKERSVVGELNMPFMKPWVREPTGYAAESNQY